MDESRAESVAVACRGVFESWQGPRILAAYVYGSVLGPRHRSDSDVDLAVLDSPHDPLTWADQSRLMDQLERALNRPVDLRMLRECALSHQAHILEHGHLFWGRSAADTNEYARTIQVRYEGQRKHAQQVWSSVLREIELRMTGPNEPGLPR